MPDISISAVDGGSFTAYLSLPPGGRGPGLVIIQEILGVNPALRQVADRYAAQGYIALAPDLFWRQQPGVQLSDESEADIGRAMALYQGFNESLGVDDLISSANYLYQHPDCTGRVGSLGFCMGGKLAYLMATRSHTECNLSFYGIGIDGILNEASAITKPLMLHVAGADRFDPPPSQQAVAEGLARNPLVTIHRYEGIDHGFARPGSSSYSAAAATLALTRTDAFLAENLI